MWIEFQNKYMNEERETVEDWENCVGKESVKCSKRQQRAVYELDYEFMETRKDGYIHIPVLCISMDRKTT